MVVITGGARDIGKAISVKMALEGAKVIICYHNSATIAEDTLAEIQNQGGDAILFKADLTQPNAVQQLVDFATRKRNGSIDLLVNNAGGLLARKKLQEQDELFYNRVLDLNFKSVFLVTRGFAGHIKEGGSIINISSQAARDGGGEGSSLYAAAKGAITAYTRSLAKELGPAGIRVNAVCPGLIEGRFHDTFTPASVREQVVAKTPVKREGRPADIANLVSFLASAEASFITGANYDINGGMLFS